MPKGWRRAGVDIARRHFMTSPPFAPEIPATPAAGPLPLDACGPIWARVARGLREARAAAGSLNELGTRSL
jgi:hypothetical protein